MFKKFKESSPVDLAFLSIAAIFILTAIYEGIKLVLQYYTFSRWFIAFILISLIYYGYKYSFNFWDFFKTAKQKITKKQSSLSILSHSKKIQEIADNIKKYNRLIAYTSFIGASCIILLSMFLNTGILLPWVLWIFTGVYLITKINGFQIDRKIMKSDISSTNTLRFFLLSFALFFIVLKLICDSFGILWNERIWIYIWFSLLYLIVGFFTFFRYIFSFKRLFRPYNILMWCVIFVLIWLLGFQNGIFSSVLEHPLFKKEIIEEMDLPGIVSNEVEVWEQKEITYTVSKVSDIYDIPAGLGIGSIDDGVSDLQKVLGNLQYFVWEVSGEFDEQTRLALVETLRSECDWPESTTGRFGPEAKLCIDSLEISTPNESVEEVSTIWANQIISAEVSLTGTGEELIQEENGWEALAVSSLYNLTAGLWIWDSWDEVSQLQTVLKQLDYYTWESDWDFNEQTRLALVETLRGECDWPESTRGIFGPQAKQCIDSLLISNSKL